MTVHEAAPRIRPYRRVMVRGVPEKIWCVPFGERGRGVVCGWSAESYGERGGVVAWVRRLGSVRAAVEQGSVSLAASTEQGGVKG